MINASGKTVQFIIHNHSTRVALEQLAGMAPHNSEDGLQLVGTDCIFFSMGRNIHNFGCTGRIKVSSTTLDSYGSLLSNTPSLAIIRAVLAMIQPKMSASKTKIFGLIKFSKSQKKNQIVEDI